jgi:conjugal transfer pilus assembly protein TrbC
MKNNLYKKIAISMILLSSAITSYALSPEDAVTSEQIKNYQQIERDSAYTYRKQVNQMTNGVVERATSKQEIAAQLQQMANEKIKTYRHKKNPYQNENGKGAILFVSFSMPDNLLKAYIEQANQYGINIIVRGFIENSFKTTIFKMKELLKQPSGDLGEGGIQIDPKAFEVYNIQRVPALVITDNLTPCQDGQFHTCEAEKYDVIYGAISIPNALERIMEKGEMSPVAAKIMAQGGGNA